jgi:hypothetical protein
MLKGYLNFQKKAIESDQVGAVQRFLFLIPGQKVPQIFPPPYSFSRECLDNGALARTSVGMRVNGISLRILQFSPGVGRWQSHIRDVMM